MSSQIEHRSGGAPRPSPAVSRDADRYVALGMIASAAPEAALLSSLQKLCPDTPVRLQRMREADARGAHYRVEVRADARDDDTTITAWLHIKSALMAAFPADKPNPVSAWDP